MSKVYLFLRYSQVRFASKPIWRAARKKHDGSYPIIGVNTFLNPQGNAQIEIEMARSTEEEKQSQLARLADFQHRNAEQAPIWLEKLQQTVIENGNVFAVLVDAVRYCSLGQITILTNLQQNVIILTFLISGLETCSARTAAERQVEDSEAAALS